MPREKLIERTNHSDAIYEAAFGAVLNAPGIDVIADIGAGDSTFAASRKARDQTVIDVDKDYAVRPGRGELMVTSDATAIALNDQSVDAAISCFLMQHLSPDQQIAALAEMIRITKKSEDEVGFIGLYPVYADLRLERVLEPYRAYTGIAFAENEFSTRIARPGIAGHRLEYPTLWIKRTEDTDREGDSLIKAIVESGALNRSTTLMDVGRRALMRLRGTNTVDLQQ